MKEMSFLKRLGFFWFTFFSILIGWDLGHEITGAPSPDVGTVGLFAYITMSINFQKWWEK